MMGLPHLLSRAGLMVDIITTTKTMRFSRFVRNIHLAESTDEMMRLVHQHTRARTRQYDWIIPTDDETLKAVRDSKWHASQRPGFLPVPIEGQPSHIFSKIGLSGVLSKAGIQTPSFRVVSSREAAVAAANELGYPVMLKVDESYGGMGTRECRNDTEVIRAVNLLEARPLLLQKKIKGDEISADSIYVQHELVHFAYSRVLRRAQSFGVSTLRRYYPLPLVDEKAFDELRMLGHALGADGFVNISCIDAEDGSGRYYIEADMRPNVWVDFSRYFGEDAAKRIREGVYSRTWLTKDCLHAPAKCEPVEIPYFLRLQWWELVLNRYRVWKYISLADANVVVRTYAIVEFWSLYCFVCSFLPRGLKTAIKRPLAVVCPRLRPARSTAPCTGDARCP